jgi:CheY-like chemotaxis protein
MGQRILIVDDEPNIVISLEFLMKKEGFEVAVATDGDAALAKGRRIHARPDPARRDDAEEIRLRGLPGPCAPIRPWRR